MKTWLAFVHRPVQGARRAGLALLVGVSLSTFVSGCDSLFGTDAEEHLSQGVEYYQEGDLAAAAIEFRNVLQKEPDHARGRFYLGVTQLRTGDSGRARRDLERALELGYRPEAVALPLAEARLAGGDPEAVLAADLVDGLSSRERARWHAVRGRAALQLDDQQRAEEQFRQALLADPASGEARFGQVLLAREQGDSETVQQWVSRVLSADDTHAGAWRMRALLELAAGRRDEAEAALDEAISHDARPRPSNLMRRGLLRFQRDDLAGAREDAETLQRAAPDTPWGPYLEGLVALREGDRSQAQTALQEAISRTDSFAPPRLFLAAIHAEAGRYEQAQYELDRYRTMSQDEPMGRLLRIGLEIARGNTEQARDLLERYRQENPGDRRALALHNALTQDQSIAEGAFVQTALSGLQGQSGGEAPVEASAQVSGDEVSTASQDDYEAIGAAISEGDYDQALNRINQLLEEHPRDAELHNLKGGAHVGRGELREALASFRNALQSDPDNIAAIRNLGQVFSRADRSDLAREVYRHGYQRHPENLDIILALARQEEEAGNPGRTEELLSEAMEHHPDALEPRLIQGRRLLARGEPQNALDVVQPVADEYSEQPGLLMLQARAYQALDDPEEAFTYWQALVRQRPEDPDVHTDLARNRVQVDDLDAARASLRRAAELAPERLEPRVLLLRTYVTVEDFETAELQYQALMEEFGADRELLSQGASLAMAQGDVGEAIRRMQRAQAVEATEQGAIGLAQAYQRAERHEDALQVLEDWRDNTETVMSRTGQHLLAELRTATGDEAGAISMYEQRLMENPDDPLTLNNLAWLLRDTDSGRALVHVEHARELVPESVDIQHTHAVVLAANGETDRAIELLEEVVAEDDRAEYRLQLGEYYVRASKHDEARDMLEPLAENQDFEGASRARALLDELRDD